MKNTLYNVQEYAKKAGLTPIQIDGIPEGFSYKLPSITISGVAHEGNYIAFIPLKEDEDVTDKTVEGLLDKYKKYA